jgi:hypothetical protein
VSMACLIGFLKFWQPKGNMDLAGLAPHALPVRARVRGRHGVLLDPGGETVGGKKMSRATWKAGDRRPRRKDRPRCHARTRAGGACLVRPEPGKARCRFHGGLSTGPRTEEGRARIAEAQRRRWRAYRATQSTKSVGHCLHGRTASS